ncbi:hypothetical protein [Paenibacillus sp. P22]|uniref:hypothetical protein n=1 Tax=Paenibacillus sp. P22 TaxID=483908 RepID=UPI000660E5F3|nr:hypothetical protein [Paenibacillus sp. P22]
MLKSWGKRKKHSLGLVVLAAATVLSACGQNNTGGAEANALKGAAESNQAAAEPVTPKSDKLVVYSALNEDDMIQLKQKFKEDTGIEMEYLNLGSAGEASTRVQAEKTRRRRTCS